jgi:hypothetical protein
VVVVVVVVVVAAALHCFHPLHFDDVIQSFPHHQKIHQ